MQPRSSRPGSSEFVCAVCLHVRRNGLNTSMLLLTGSYREHPSRMCSSRHFGTSPCSYSDRHHQRTTRIRGSRLGPIRVRQLASSRPHVAATPTGETAPSDRRREVARMVATSARTDGGWRVAAGPPPRLVSSQAPAGSSGPAPGLKRAVLRAGPRGWDYSRPIK